MAGKVVSPISEETFGLLRKHPDFLEPLRKVCQKDASLTPLNLCAETGLDFIRKNPDAHTEAVQLKNGDLEVRFFYPLDDDGDPKNGRLYGVDRVVFDHQDPFLQKFQFDRSVHYNWRGSNHAQWLHRQKALQGAAELDDSVVKHFVDHIVPTYARPLHSKHLQVLEKLYAEEQKNPNVPSYLSSLETALQQYGGLQLKWKDPHNRITLIPGSGGFYDVVLSMVVDDGDPDTQGPLYVQDRFTFYQNTMLGRDRQFVVDQRSEDSEAWEKKRQALYQEDGTTLHENLVLSKSVSERVEKHFKPLLTNRQPDFNTRIADEFARLGDSQPLNDEQIQTVFQRVGEQSNVVNADQFEPQLLKVLKTHFDTYYAPLREVLGADFAWALEERAPRFQILRQEERTEVRLFYSFGDPALDGVERGEVIFVETFSFQDKNLQPIKREVRLEGADPEGRLEPLRARLEAAIQQNKLPDREQARQGDFLGHVFSYVAPHVLGHDKIQKVQEISLVFQSLEEGLLPILYSSNINPQFRVLILRSLLQLKAGELQKGRVELEQLLAVADEKDQAATFQGVHSLQDQQSRDTIRTAEVIRTLASGNWDIAFEKARGFYSPQLQQVFDEVFLPIQTRQRNQQALNIFKAVAWDQVRLEASESRAWLSGEDYNVKTAQQAVEGLFHKAQHKTLTSSAASPLEVLKELEYLTKHEKTLRDRLLKNVLFRELNDIAQEPHSERKARQYFFFAHGPLMNAKLLGAAQYLAQYVVVHHLPPTPVLEGLQIIERLVTTRLEKKLLAEEDSSAFQQQQKRQVLSALLTQAKFLAVSQRHATPIQILNSIEEPALQALRDSITKDEFFQNLSKVTRHANPNTRFEKYKQLFNSMKAVMDVQDFDYLDTRLQFGKLVPFTSKDFVQQDPRLSLLQKKAHLETMHLDSLSEEVQDFLAYTQGQGSFGIQAEFFTRNLVDQLTRPTTLAVMLGTGLAGPAVEGFILGVLPEGVPAVLGMGGAWFTARTAEGFIFSNGIKLSESAFYSPDGHWDNYWGDVATSALTFNAFGLGGAGVGAFSEHMLAAGRLGQWAGRPVVVSELGVMASPLGRFNFFKPLPTGAVPQLTVAGQRFTTFLHHTSGVTSLATAPYVADHWFGWREVAHESFGQYFGDSLVMYPQALVMFKGANWLTNGAYQNAIFKMRLQNAKIAEARLGIPIPEIPQLAAWSSKASKTEVVAKLAKMPLAEQLSLARRIGKSKNLVKLQERLEKSPHEVTELLLGELEGLLNGKIPLKEATEFLGFRARVEALMKAEVESFKQDNLSTQGYEFKFPSKLSELQRNYFMTRQIREFELRIESATSIKDITRALEQSAFKTLDGKPVETLKKAIQQGETAELVQLSGLKNKVQELLKVEPVSETSN